MAVRDLCTSGDVTSYAPGYTSDATTDALIVRLVTSESRSFHQQTGREVKAIDPAVATRRFDVAPWNARHRMVQIGDITTVTTVKIIDPDQTTELETVATANRVSLPRVREEWEPITGLYFPYSSASPVTLSAGYVVEVNGTWGFPSVPADVKEAVAGMVLWRYVSDVSAAGTRFAEALAEINVSAIFANAQSVIEGYRGTTAM